MSATPTPTTTDVLPALQSLGLAITVRREQRVILDSDLMFELTAEEFAKKHGGRRYAPRLFTKHGAPMATMVLNSLCCHK